MDWLTLDQISDRIGLTIASIRTYHGKAERNRRQGTPRGVDMPPPDRIIGRSPVWLPETIERWEAARAAWRPQGPFRS